jgi:predicted nuclease with TOPRIM domain
MVSEQKSDQEKLKELKKAKKQLEDQLELVKAEVESLREANEELKENCRIMEQVIYQLIKDQYGGRIYIDFDKFKLCSDNKCVQFDTYRELLIALKLVKLFLPASAPP